MDMIKRRSLLTHGDDKWQNPDKILEGMHKAWGRMNSTILSNNEYVGRYNSFKDIDGL